MRLAILSLVLASAGLVGATAPASAQSPYSYPWCAKSVRGTTTCYFTSRQQCMTWQSGNGAYCFPSPYYGAPGPQQGSPIIRAR
jgi:uncharacterized protein DUF3551